ncbi:MAG: RnfABCDGE type electron transport complex subunit B [Planctomycetota bacterium]|nr:RnfABCDGE type electron transport complex subunit B [Planctomycetota bacterium]
MITVTSVSIGLAAAVLVILAIVVGYILGWANRAFHVEVDPAVAKINEALPGANCGGCGYVGCSEYAEAVAAGQTATTLCAPGGNACSQTLADILGVEAQQTEKQLAVVHCGATVDERLGIAAYDGEKTCAAANLVAGVQGCAYGCLGYGDCARACPYDAIHVENGLAAVDRDKCLGCNNCVAACPRGVISMVPFGSERTLVVTCSNRDFGPDVKLVCQTGCIGCKACAKVSDAVAMNGNLPVIDYDKLETDGDLEAVVAKCPMNALAVAGVTFTRPAARGGGETQGKRTPTSVQV